MDPVVARVPHHKSIGVLFQKPAVATRDSNCIIPMNDHVFEPMGWPVYQMGGSPNGHRSNPYRLPPVSRSTARSPSRLAHGSPTGTGTWSHSRSECESSRFVLGPFAGWKGR